MKVLISGAGYEVAERMGIVVTLHEVGYRMEPLREVSRRGRQIARLDPRSLLGPIGNRLISIARADLAVALFGSLQDVETIFDDSVEALDDNSDDVQVTFTSGSARQFLPTWSRGRVVLVGDAAACPSLLAGQGAALARVEAYVLAAELGSKGSDYAAAFDAYERQLAPMVRDKQNAALATASIFAPRNRRQLLFRNGMFKLMSLPLVSRLATGRVLQDLIELPPPPQA